jgi:uncharacterized alpha-E superfamily protein
MLLSRVAENLYWMSRYVERAENLARLLHVGFYLELDAAELAYDGGDRPVESVLNIFGCRDAYSAGGGTGARDEILRFLTFDRENPQSILRLVAAARENARGTQETVSAEAWSHVNRLYLYLSGPRAQRRFRASPSRFFDAVKRGCILFGGLIDSTLPRTGTFHFLQAGRYLERVEQVGRVLLSKAPALCPAGPGDGSLSLGLVHWTSLLRSCSAYEAYLRSYQDRIDPVSVVRYLVLDADFPRSVRFGIARCRESLHAVGGSDEAEVRSEAERRLGRLDSELRYLDVDEIFERGLPSFLLGVQDACGRIGDEVHRAYFAS